ncbi:unnamed protein product, partial [Mesorhabditis spiculigera]
MAILSKLAPVLDIEGRVSKVSVIRCVTPDDSCEQIHVNVRSAVSVSHLKLRVPLCRTPEITNLNGKVVRVRVHLYRHKDPNALYAPDMFPGKPFSTIRYGCLDECRNARHNAGENADGSLYTIREWLDYLTVIEEVYGIPRQYYRPSDPDFIITLRSKVDLCEGEEPNTLKSVHLVTNALTGEFMELIIYQHLRCQTEEMKLEMGKYYQLYYVGARNSNPVRLFASTNTEIYESGRVHNLK